MTPEQFGGDLSGLRRKSTICFVAAVVALIVTIILVRINFIPAIITGAAAAGMFFAGSRFGKQAKEMTIPLRREVLESRMELDSYEPDSHFPRDLVKSTKLFSGWSSIHGSDLVTGRYRGVPLRFCDLKLTHEESDGDNSTRTVTDFSGTFLEIRCDRSISGAVRIKEKRKGLFEGKVVETENEAFNKQFTVTADNPQEAFYVLTPQFMETIVKADAYANAKTQMLFKDNLIYVGLYNSKDLFEGKGKKTMEDYRLSCEQDLAYVTNFLDMLFVNSALFHL